MNTKRFVIVPTGRVVDVEVDKVTKGKKTFDIVSGLSLSYLNSGSLSKLRADVSAAEGNLNKVKTAGLLNSEGHAVDNVTDLAILSPEDCFKALVRTIQSALPPYIELDQRVNTLVKLMNTLHPITVGGRDKVNVLSGCHVLFGSAGSGKTTMMRLINKVATEKGNPCIMIVTGEPSSVSTRFDIGMLGLLCGLCAFENNIILFDSLRHLLYAQSGSTLAGGVSSSLLDVVTTLSVIGEYTGNALCVAVNPLASNDEKYTLLLEALRGSSTSVINLSTNTADGTNNNFENAEVSSRRSENREFVSLKRTQIADMLTEITIVESNDDSSDSLGIFSDASKYDLNTVSGSGRQGLVALNGSDLVDRELGDLRKLYMPMFN